MKRTEEGDTTAAKQTMTIRLTGCGHRLLAELARRQGISRTAVLELLIRKESEEKGVG
jgi:hypothetical protein